MQTLKAAIVGCGAVCGQYIPALQTRFSVIELVGCCDAVPQRAQTIAAQYGLQAMQWEEILASADIGLVLNLTSPAAHYPLTRQALEAGKHVYSEKTLAASFEDAAALCRLADQKGLRLGCAPDTFLGGGLQTARWALDKRLAGDIASGILTLTRDYRVYGENLPHLFAPGGSIAYDMGCYYFTALCSLLGPVQQVFAFGSKTEQAHLVQRVDSPLWGQQLPLAECNVLAGALEFACGALISLQFNSATVLDETFYLELYGSRGILRLGDPNTFGGPVILHKAKNTPVTLPFTHGYQQPSRGLGAAEMAHAILAGRPHRASMQLACHVQEIIHGLHTAAESGLPYRLTTAFERPAPLPEGYIGQGFWEPTEETALL